MNKTIKRAIRIINENPKITFADLRRHFPLFDDRDRNTLPGPFREAMNVAEREIWKRAYPTKPSMRFRLRKFPFGRP